MSPRVWLWLIGAQTVWAGSYVAMQAAVGELPVGAVVALRYGLASLGFLVLFAFRGFPRVSRGDGLLIAALGAVNFTVSPSLQLWALQYTRAMDVAILVALEPVVTVLMAALVLRESVSFRTVFAGFLGLAGALVLSGVGLNAAGVGEAGADRLLGNLLFLTSIVCEASVTTAGARLARRYDPLAAMGLLKGAGFLAALVVYAGVWHDVSLSEISGGAWGALLYLAWAASLVSYTVWYAAIREAPVSRVAVTLFLQPVVGALLGWWIAGEAFTRGTVVGGALILAAFAVNAREADRGVEPLPQ